MHLGKHPFSCRHVTYTLQEIKIQSFIFYLAHVLASCSIAAIIFSFFFLGGGGDEKAVARGCSLGSEEPPLDRERSIKRSTRMYEKFHLESTKRSTINLINDAVHYTNIDRVEDLKM